MKWKIKIKKQNWETKPAFAESLARLALGKEFFF
jgi:hypothetical protein